MTFDDILYVFLVAMVPLLLHYFHQLVSATVADTRHKEAVDAVFTAVEYVNQTFVDSLKESGNFDTKAQLEAFERAKDAALYALSSATAKWLEKTYTDLDGWLTIQIESAVKTAKGAA